MHLIETTPAPCSVCGRGNTADSRGERPRFVDFERDINWNDPLIICEDCLATAGTMVGMISQDGITDMKIELKQKDRQIHELKSDMDGMKRRAKRLGMTFERAGAAS